MASKLRKFGARVTLLPGNRVQIYQTELSKSASGKSERYILKGDPSGAWKDIADVVGIGEAVLAALAGKLP